jgi:hypothetical protein
MVALGAGMSWRPLPLTLPRAAFCGPSKASKGHDGLIRREDYDVDILGGSTGAHYMSGYTRVGGIMLPTGHRIFARTPEGQALPEPLLVSIDLSEITFA